MWLEDYLLQGEEYPEKSRERARIRMLSFAIIFPGLALIFCMFDIYWTQNHLVPLFELSALVLVLLSLLLYPKVLNLTALSYTLLTIFTGLLLGAFYIPYENTLIVFFWFAVLPVGIFYLLGALNGARYSVAILAIIVVLILLDYLDLLVPQFSLGIYLQLLFGYASISYILYVIEEERDQAETELRHAFESNKILFKEMHHRTKNNMQVIMGLLETQSFKTENPKCQKMLQAHIDRIKAMSFVHKNLYMGASVDKVDMHKYLGEIIESLQRITPHTLIADIDYISVDIKNSINIGLIVNEAVSNAIEHAYGGGSGRIDVSLKEEDGRLRLTIRDYGFGFNHNREFSSLGMSLIEDLSRDLPEGELHIDTSDGTHIEIYFKLKEA